MNRRLPVVPVYLAYKAAGGFLVSMMSILYSVFLILRLEFNPFQLVLMGTILEGSYLLCELPTGVIADLVSRRTMLIVGLFGTGLSFALLGLSRGFGTAAISQVMFGFFAACSSGSDVAWLTDEVGEESSRHLYLKGEQFSSLARFVGIFVGVELATISLRLPMVASGVGFCVLALGLVVVMPEDHFARPEREKGTRIHHSFLTTLNRGIRDARAHPVLLLILGTAALHGASTEGFDRLADLHLLNIGLPAFGHLSRLWWFAILDAVSLLVGFGALAYVKRRRACPGTPRSRASSR